MRCAGDQRVVNDALEQHRDPAQIGLQHGIPAQQEPLAEHSVNGVAANGEDQLSVFRAAGEPLQREVALQQKLRDTGIQDCIDAKQSA